MADETLNSLRSFTDQSII